MCTQWIIKPYVTFRNRRIECALGTQDTGSNSGQRLAVAPFRKYHPIWALKDAQEFHREEEIRVPGRGEET